MLTGTGYLMMQPQALETGIVQIAMGLVTQRQPIVDAVVQGWTRRSPMTNEYGITLDRNGYAPSIIPHHTGVECWECGRNGCGKMDRHEVFFGSNREKSKRLGLWVHLCHDSCHIHGVHDNREMDLRLKCAAQLAAMEHYNWTVDQFRAEFGKNYLEGGYGET